MNFYEILEHNKINNFLITFLKLHFQKHCPLGFFLNVPKIFWNFFHILFLYAKIRKIHKFGKWYPEH